jgi:two-component system, NarL family, nitrate/nitrite response regulator NarL
LAAGVEEADERGGGTVTGATTGPERVTVIVSRLEPIVHRGLVEGLVEHGRFDVLDSRLTDAALERAIAEHAPCVVILNETMDASLLVRLRSSQPPAGVLVLAKDDPPRFYATLMRAAGARWLTWSALPADVVVAVDILADDQRRPRTVDAKRGQRPSPIKAHRLTERERKVFELLSEGRSYGEIAVALHIAPETVRTHTARICRKLGVQSKRDLIGMVLPEDF